MAAYEPGLSSWTVAIICLPRDAIWTHIPLTASTQYAELFFEESFLARMLIINADRVSFVTASLAEVRPENGSGSEPIAEAATSSIYTTTAGDGGGSGRAGDGSSDAKAGCPGAGGRRETDAARVVLLELLDTSLGLRSRSRKGGAPRPRPRPPWPPPRRARETTIFLRDRSNACGVWGRGHTPPLVDSTKRNVSRRNTTKALQKDFRRLEEI
jgi:hypothetical protein